MDGDITTIVAGPAEAKFDGAGLGHTEGGISVAYTPTWRDRTVDQYGATPVDLVLTGEELVATTPLAEWSMSTLEHILHDADVSSSGDGVGIGKAAGSLATPGKLELIPLLDGDNTKLVELYRAAPVGAFDVTFDAESDRIFECEHRALVDETKEAGNYLGRLVAEDSE